MADRRMFAKTIVCSDEFNALSATARCLYFALGMNADDDGFVDSPRGIMNMCGSSEKDMLELVNNKYVLAFKEGLIVITHWKLNNYLRSDRYKSTRHKNEKAMLSIGVEGEYVLSEDIREEQIIDVEEAPEWKRLREEAFKDSDLPYSFSYKIRNAFIGKPCPVCGYKMENYEGSIHAPTIQHNKPIRMGGKHEIGNISVICKHCNESIRANETGDLNNAEVIVAWNEISNNVGIPSIGQDRLGKVSIGQVSVPEWAPSVEDVAEYANDHHLTNTDVNRFYEYFCKCNWTYKGKPIDWKERLMVWDKTEFPKKNKKPTAEENRAQMSAEFKMSGFTSASYLEEMLANV